MTEFSKPFPHSDDDLYAKLRFRWADFDAACVAPNRHYGPLISPIAARRFRKHFREGKRLSHIANEEHVTPQSVRMHIHSAIRRTLTHIAFNARDRERARESWTSSMGRQIAKIERALIVLNAYHKEFFTTEAPPSPSQSAPTQQPTTPRSRDS